MSQQLIDFYSLLPAVYRVDDAAQGEPLKALMAILSEQANLVRQNIDELWDDFFIETCAEWVVPYIGDLVGNTPIPEALHGRRGDVARTIYFRRRKGSLAMLEEMARFVTGWSVHAVEFFQLLGWTQNLNHLRPGVGTADLRNLDSLDRIQSAFDECSHTVDVRPMSENQGWWNIPRIGFFAWRLGSYQLDDVTPRRAPGNAHGYHFSPLGNPAPLFHLRERETDDRGVAQEIHVDGPIRPTGFHFRPSDEYQPAAAGGATPAGISIFLDAGNSASRVPPEKIVCKNLPNWERPPAGKVAIDVGRGRFTFAPGDEPADLANIAVRYVYGFSTDLGGGPYDRANQRDPDTIAQPDTLDDLLLVAPGQNAAVGDALTAWNVAAAPTAVIEIADSRTYVGDITLDKPGDLLIIQARNGQRPLMRGVVRLAVGAPTRVILDGLVIEGRIEVAADSRTTRLALRHCTLVPGRGLDEAGAPRIPNAASIIVGDPNPNLTVELTRCISGPVQASASLTQLRAVDTILDAMPGALAAGGMASLAVATPVLVAGGAPPFTSLTAPAPAFFLRMGDVAPRRIELPPAGAPTPPNALQNAIRAADPTNPAFASARVLTLGNRRVIIPGVVTEVTASAAPGDPTLTQLRLNTAGGPARQTHALLGGAITAAFPLPGLRLTLTMEPDAPLAAGRESHPLNIAAGAAGVSELATRLRNAIRGASASPAFANALAGEADGRLVIVAGAAGFTPLFEATAENVGLLAALGLATPRPAISANLSGAAEGPPTWLEQATVLGRVHVKKLEMASNCIFTDRVACAQVQDGCMRFSYMPPQSITPRRYRCQPDLVLEAIAEGDAAGREAVIRRLTPLFTSLRYGQPAYGQLALACARELRAGGDNSAEMGAFNHLMQPQREAGLRIRLQEYLPVGLEAGVIYVT
jgi:hypothetical protein